MLFLFLLLFLLFCDCFGAGTAERNLWSSRRTSVTSYWRRKAVGCLRRDIVSVTHRAKRRPWRSTWTVVPWETLGRTEAQKVSLWHMVWPLQESNQTPGLNVEPKSDLKSSSVSRWTRSHSEPPGWLKHLLCTIVYCTIKFKGKYKRCCRRRRRLLYWRIIWNKKLPTWMWRIWDWNWPERHPSCLHKSLLWN